MDADPLANLMEGCYLMSIGREATSFLSSKAVSDLSHTPTASDVVHQSFEQSSS